MNDWYIVRSTGVYAKTIAVCSPRRPNGYASVRGPYSEAEATRLINGGDHGDRRRTRQTRKRSRA